MKKVILPAIAALLLLPGCSHQAAAPAPNVDAVQHAQYQKVEEDTSLPPQVRQMVRQQEQAHR